MNLSPLISLIWVFNLNGYPHLPVNATKVYKCFRSTKPKPLWDTVVYHTFNSEKGKGSNTPNEVWMLCKTAHTAFGIIICI